MSRSKAPYLLSKPGFSGRPQDHPSSATHSESAHAVEDEILHPRSAWRPCEFNPVSAQCTQDAVRSMQGTKSSKLVLESSVRWLDVCELDACQC